MLNFKLNLKNQIPAIGFQRHLVVILGSFSTQTTDGVRAFCQNHFSLLEKENRTQISNLLSLLF